MVKEVVNSDDVPRKEFTLEAFLNNPSGNKGTNGQARRLFLESLEEKVRKLLKAEKKFISRIVNCGNSLFIHVQVPSETFDDFHYDAVIEFENYSKSLHVLNKQLVRFYVNSPSFLFSAAHVFKFYGILIPSFFSKFKDEVFKELPDTRNPDFEVYHEKILTMALIHIRNNDLLKLSDKALAIKSIPLAKFVASIPNAQKKLEEYKALQVKASAEKKAAKKKAKEEPTEKKTPASKTVNSKVKRTINLDGKKTTSKTVNSKVSSKVNSKLDNKVNNKVKNKIDD